MQVGTVNVKVVRSSYVCMYVGRYVCVCMYVCAGRYSECEGR